MGWFDEQIRQRVESDQEILEDSFFRMAEAVMNKKTVERLMDERVVTREALGEILKYYHWKMPEIPETITDPGEQLAFALRPFGLMTRKVKLEEGWQNDAFGPMLATMRDSGAMVALLPGTLFGYHYKDPTTGKKIRVTRKNAKQFELEGICFYKPLPQKKLGIPDLLLYMKNSIATGDFILIALFSLIAVLVGMIGPQILSKITGPILRSKQLNLLAGAGIFLLCSTFTQQLIEMIRSLLMSRINTKTSQAVQASVMIRILSLPVSFFRGFSSGELSSRANSVDSLCTMIINSILSMGLSSLMSLLYITQIFKFAPGLVWPSILIILATLVLNIAASLLQVRITRQKMKLAAEETGMTYATLNGIQKIRLSGSEKRVFARWGRLYAQNAQLEYNPPMFLKLNRVLTTAVSLLGTVLLYYIALQTGVGDSEYYAFNAAYGHVSAAFGALAGIAISVAAIKPVLEMAEPILQAEPEVSSERKPIPPVSGHIELSHVSFRYEPDAPYILDDLSLQIKAGEYVAIVGRTGCGKSTLVKLLLGFEKPEKGVVTYDRHDLNTIDPRSLRKQIGVVIQNGQLFHGDIFSNITISAPQLTLDQAWEAAETAGIAQDIREMPMGMQTIIAEGQGGISGGQKQRLMIARAIAPKPKILIFDEATSALDNKTQKQVSDALDKLRCTRIVIAHRLSTIKNCDRILVMDKGAIIEEGTYEELMALNGNFADLVARQRLDNEE